MQNYDLCYAPDDWHLAHDDALHTALNDSQPADVEEYRYAQMHDKHGNYFRCASAHLMGQHNDKPLAMDKLIYCKRYDCAHCRAVHVFRLLKEWGYNKYDQALGIKSHLHFVECPKSEAQRLITRIQRKGGWYSGIQTYSTTILITTDTQIGEYLDHSGDLFGVVSGWLIRKLPKTRILGTRRSREVYIKLTQDGYINRDAKPKSEWYTQVISRKKAEGIDLAMSVAGWEIKTHDHDGGMYIPKPQTEPEHISAVIEYLRNR